MELMSTIDHIRKRQGEIASHPIPVRPPMRHQPDMLYIGCIDARLDVLRDIGIDIGKALIFRNIGALVRHTGVSKDELKSTEVALSENNLMEVPHNVSIGATLEFFLNHIEPGKEGVKDIVISGHTDCGGLKACRDQAFKKEDSYLPVYVKSLDDVRAKVMEEAKAGGWEKDPDRILKALEEESVRKSMDNLLSYPVVQRMIKEGKLRVHGWVINTGTKRINEMNLETRQFAPMVEAQKAIGRG